MIQQYLQDLFHTAAAGSVREESFYPDLKKLLETWSIQHSQQNFITTLPKKTEAGNPDFRILNTKKDLVGYIEAKDPSNQHLDIVESSEQLNRYRSTFHNLILTNFFDFRLYREGQLIDQVTIGKQIEGFKLKIIPPAENQDKFNALLEKFFSFSIPQTKTAKQLAIELAKRTRFLRDQVISEELREEKIEGTQTLESFHHAFKEHLISSLTEQDFANLFAQTITYGLFAARSRADSTFNRKLAYDYIPHTIGILRDVFKFISLSSDLSQNMEWIIDDIAEVLNAADVKKIMHDFYVEGKGRDPIIHFYETFLSAYDPKEREKRGVYYTPEPVVSYIVRSIHQILKDKFNKPDGFADHSVTVLDPAAGTMPFPAKAIELAVNEYKAKYGDGGVSGLVRDHILKDFYAFELMMAPYAIGHLKMGFILEELGYKMADEERFHLYLTNTLDFSKEDPDRFPGIFERTLSEESKQALSIKEHTPVMVIMGNPPYSGSSDNRGLWILDQIKKYRFIEDESINEKNPKWLQDDYVKFIRFGQWKIEQAGVGILGFITNHAWLDNPTFRAMRYSLLKTFDEVYVVNLHGSTLKKEVTPEGAKDENVFDIKAGVAITIAIKYQKPIEKKQVYYIDKWGLREDKYEWLDDHSMTNTDWQTLEPQIPHYFLVKKDNQALGKYQQYSNVTDIFPIKSVGVVTGRDEFVMDFDRQALESRIRQFIESQDSDEQIKQFFHLEDKPKSHWYVSKAREQLKSVDNLDQHITKILYRPFDERWIFYHPSVIERSRKNVMKNLLQPNLALISARSNRLSHIDSFFCSNNIVETKCGESTVQSYTFPLYIFSEKEAQDSLFDENENTQVKNGNLEWKNLPIEIQAVQTFDSKISKNCLHPREAIFYYIYSVLHSNIYRQKYQEFLKTDFPRIPFTSNMDLFHTLAELGEQLVDLHLLKSSSLNNPIAKFQGADVNLVEKPTYDQNTHRIYINSSQYFENILPDLWNYYIGGYQVLNKWLKDRKGRYLSSEEIRHYCRVVTALSQTIEIQKQIDHLYPQVEASLTNLNQK